MLFSISETKMRVSPTHWKEMTLILLLKEESFILVFEIRHMTLQLSQHVHIWSN